MTRLSHYTHAIAAIAICIAAPRTCVAQAPVPDSAAIEQKLNEAISKMSLESKIDLLGGSDGFYLLAVPEAGAPRIRMSDGPMGVRGAGPTTAYTNGVALAATWDTDLAEQVGIALGRDARSRGVHILLAPGVNMYRAPMAGRSFEYAGEDPILAGRLAVGYIRGVQSQGVVATIKHFAANNEEYDRHDVDSVVDERTLRELYLPAFEMAVKDGKVGAIMDSYNLLNGEHTTQSRHLNCEIAKHEWGFDGIVMSDWEATYDGVAAAKGCLDVEMPYAKAMTRAVLMPAVKIGTVTLAEIDEKVRRILRLEMRFQFTGRDQTDLSIGSDSVASLAVAQRGALEAPVLLKNEEGALPFGPGVKRIAVIGPNAYPYVTGGGSAMAIPFSAKSLLEGLVARGGNAVEMLYDRGLPEASAVFHETKWTTPEGKTGVTSEAFAELGCKGTLLEKNVIANLDAATAKQTVPRQAKSVCYSAIYTPKASGKYLLLTAALGTDSYRVTVDGHETIATEPREYQAPKDSYVELTASKPASVRVEYTESHIYQMDKGESVGLTATVSVGLAPVESLPSERAKLLAAKADAVVVAVGFDQRTEHEGMDRPFELPFGQAELIRTMAAANPRTVVVLNAGGAADAQPWLNQVRGLIDDFYPGQEGGEALAKLLFGDANFSGRLPFTFERSWEESPVHDSYYADKDKRVVYREGLFNGYRYYTSAGKQPLFPFGFGLSYTAFTFSDLKLSSGNVQSGEPVTAKFRVTNTGTRAGTAIAQVYVEDPSAKVKRPIRELKDFARMVLAPGESRDISVTLNARAMSFYDVAAKAWKIDPGKFVVKVGESSENLPLAATFEVRK
ncbi:beta-glucosidase [Granulicella rosea]|uniref:Beta-glucosidase n=1 Tax=Granulicella rosea TaxID=474952 RepID=A0A239EB36_9BACT|nr:glycoside hydrolase family 3 C-terminal domain-containing protein [Granulicella rosea]SNS41691.1 beta-glucosidase [Granulicella rosea]